MQFYSLSGGSKTNQKAATLSSISHNPGKGQKKEELPAGEYQGVEYFERSSSLVTRYHVLYKTTEMKTWGHNRKLNLSVSAPIAVLWMHFSVLAHNAPDKINRGRIYEERSSSKESAHKIRKKMILDQRTRYLFRKCYVLLYRHTNTLIK